MAVVSETPEVNEEASESSKEKEVTTDSCFTERPVNDIPVFGVDATDSAKALIADGKMTGTIMQDAQGMADCISDLVANAGSGQDVVANVDTERFVIAENVANKIYVPYGIYTGAAE